MKSLDSYLLNTGVSFSGARESRSVSECLGVSRSVSGVSALLLPGLLDAYGLWLPDWYAELTWAPARAWFFSNFWEPAVAYPWPTRDLPVTYPWAGELEDLLFPGASGAGPPPSVVGGASAGVWVVGILSSLVPPAAAVRAQTLDAQPTPRPL